MHHSSGVRIYRSGTNEEGMNISGGGGSLADEEEDKDNDHHDECKVQVDLVI